MGDIWENIGILAVVSLIVYICKKILEWHDYSRSSFCEDENVYRAADEFVHGASCDAVKAVLLGCLFLDAEDAEEIMSLSTPHRSDRDGGYRAFIRAVNKVLGEDIYDAGRHIHEVK